MKKICSSKNLAPLWTYLKFFVKVRYSWKNILTYFFHCPKNVPRSILSFVCILSFRMLFVYSSVPNRSACTFINFEKKFPPAQPYFGLHVYWFWERIPPCTFIWVAIKFKIKSSKLKTACNFVKKSKFVINNSTDMSK